jgi:hypothetical protein
MAGTFFGARDHPAHPPVKRAAPASRRAGIDAASQQGMGETQARTIDLDDPAGLCLLQQGEGRTAHDALDQLDGGLGQHRHREQRLLDVGTEAGDPCCDDLVESLG